MIVAYEKNCIYCGESFVDVNGDRDGDMKLCDCCLRHEERLIAESDDFCYEEDYDV
jgi:hypothetical protein